MFLPDNVKKALGILAENGYEGYVVGGSVRDALLGKTPGDYDMAVSSLPEETKRCFEAYRVIETGIKHGTVTVLMDGEPLELTTFRCDGEYKDNRHPESVRFTGTLEDDLARRDFTVNAMAYSPEKGLIDLFGGEEDLKNGVLRCVGEPKRRFEEDALRILRLLRFAAALGFRAEEKTAEAASELAYRLKSISAERIFTELKKLLDGKSADAVLIQYADILSAAVPELGGMTEDGNRFVASKTPLMSGTENKLALLFSSLGADTAEKALRGLRCDNKTLKTVLFLLTNAEREFASVGEVKRFAGENGLEKLSLLLSYRQTVGKTDDNLLKDGIRAASEKNACNGLADLAVNGSDLAALGYKGKEIGRILTRLLGEVTEGRIINSKSTLINSIHTPDIDK